MAPPNSSSFSVSVVLPASGWEMIANVRRFATSRRRSAGQGFAQSTSGDQSGAQTTTRPAAAAADKGSSSAPSSGATSASPSGPSGQSMNPSGTGSMSSAKAIPPSKSETSDSAFKKLDASNKGYVTRDDAKSV